MFLASQVLAPSMGEIYESNFQGKYLGKVDEVHILTNYYSNVDHKLEVSQSVATVLAQASS